MEEKNEAKPQAGEASTPQPLAGNTTPEPQAGEGEIEQISLEDAKKLRSEASNLRKRLKDAEALTLELKAFKEQIDAERLTDQEKQQLAHKQREQQIATLQQERDTVIQQMQSLRITNEVMKHGQKLSIVDLDAAAKLLDTSHIEYDESSGSPTNIEALLKAMVKERSWLVGARPQSSGGATNPPRSQSSGPQPLSWDTISRMSADEYRARRAEIQKWMSDNPMPR